MRRTHIRLSTLPPTIRTILARTCSIPSTPGTSSVAPSTADSSASSSSSTHLEVGGGAGAEQITPTTTTIHGWIKSVRAHKNVTFLEVNDGSQSGGLQAVLKGRGRAEGLTNGSSIRLTGTLNKSKGAGQAVELLVEDLSVLGSCDPEVYPIQKKSLPPSVLRDNAHLRFRTSQTAAVMRVRDALARDWHDWFEENGFTHVHTPILTGSDCEGAGEVFTLHDPPSYPSPSSSSSSQDGLAFKPFSTNPFLNTSPVAPSGSPDSAHTHSPSSSASSSSSADPFFPHPVHLTVSSQLHLEAPTHALSRTYTLSPAFRAEPSLTSRHLSEFYMLEAEVAWVETLDGLLDTVEAGVKGALRSLLSERQRGKRTREDLKAISKSHSLSAEDGTVPTPSTSSTIEQKHDPDDPIQHLCQVVETPFKRITYTSALQLLTDLNAEETFLHPPPRWGESIAAEHEKRLASHFGGPVFVTRYPKTLKPFYMLPTNAENRPASSSSANAEAKAEAGAERISEERERTRETVECFDLLFPHLGEMAGGSLREHRLPHLVRAIEQANMKKEEYQWYLDLRRYGSVPHGGWGMGWERWVCWVTGVGNVRDVVGFPRWKGHCRY